MERNVFSVAARTVAPNLAPSLFQIISSPMGKQHNKEIKRSRRKQLLKRRKEAAKVAKAGGRKPKAAATVKKKAPAKKPAAKTAEVTPE